MQLLSKPYLKKIDVYIIKKFLGTFFLAIALIIGISIVFDISEHIDEFISRHAPLRAIVFDFYLNFIPYFANLFSSLFTFIAVIYFTSKMAYNSEIIAILASGVTYKRLMRPYMIGAGIIALMSWTLGNFVIPPANTIRIDFTNKYLKGEYNNQDRNIHRQLEPGLYIYMRNYNNKNDVGYKFSIEKFKDHKLVSKLISDYVKWDRDKKKWVIHNYYIRDLSGPTEKITSGAVIDTTLRMKPEDFGRQKNLEETMNYWELNHYIEDLKLRGVDNVVQYEIEKHKRTSGPFSTFILSIIGAALASRKIRGGMGLHLGIGLLLSFSYIMFLQVSTVFATKGGMDPFIAVWIPNLLYSIIAIFLYRWASK
ncbi:LptF/LptG family permease [Prolixibacter sp. NT017]|uniref:LptF/LptG family permease n=1 Tax=Prolixibacter sp. NT017 TaxID=2652390 RepID=UPI001277DC57|nr:LptF/LptG family permease [Prolixibacter sp. NT017]GET26739.1 membrane protein [Prolixibacter sp. NT017]